MTDIIENFAKVPVSVIILAHQKTPLLEQVIVSSLPAQEVLLCWTGEGELVLGPKLSHQHIKILSLPKVTDFASTRNEASKHASQEWVFFVDSDEVIDSTSWRTLKEIIQQEEIQGITILRKDIFLGKELKWGEVSGVRILRIFRKSVGSFQRSIHEVAVVEGQVISAQIVLWHYAHESVASFFSKIIQYTKQETFLRESKGEHFSLLKLLLWPSGKFLYNLILRGGILDGWRGMIYAVIMSIHSFSIRALQYEKDQEKS
jgi:hypothetical protein